MSTIEVSLFTLAFILACCGFMGIVALFISEEDL